MADLTEQQSSIAAKITGSDSSGVETNYVNATTNGLMVDGSAVTQPISAAALPLPTGAATSALQTTGNSSLATIVSALTLALGSTTSGQTGNLILGAVTTGSPTYTTAQTNALSLTTAGALRVDGSAVTQPISGTVTANQGGTWTVQPGNTANTTPWLVTDSSDGSVAAGTAATKASLIALVYNTSLPTLTTGQQAAAQADSSGRLIVAPLTNASVVKAQLQDNSGTAITLGQKVMASSVPVVIASDQTHFPIELQDGSGNAITSSSDGLAGNQLLHVQVPDTTTSSTTLGALNATISIKMAGLASSGFQLTAGTLIGTLTPQCSVDGGTTWTNCSFYNPATGSVTTNVTFTSANATTILAILPVGGSSNVQVVVTAYTSGTANALLRASQVIGVAGTSAVLEDPQTLQYANIDTRSELRVASATLLIGNEQTGSTLDTNMWNTVVSGSGTSAVSGGQNTLSTGTTSNSSAFLGSLLRGRFLTGTVNAFVGGVKLGDTGVANNVRRWGAYDSSDGVYFVLNGTTIGIGIRSSSSDTVVTSLNGSRAFILDTNYHSYEIQWSSNLVYFYQDGNLIHTYKTTTAPLATTSSFKLGFETTNSGGSTTNAQLYVRGSSIMRYGQAIARPRYFHPFYTSRVQTAANFTSSNSTTLATTINPTSAGNAIIVTVTANAGSITCTDSASQTYTAAVSVASGAKITYTFYTLNTAAGVTSVTITDGSSTALNMVVSEYSNIMASSASDKTASNSGTGTSWTSTATATTTQANELLIGALFDTAHNNSTFSPGISWNTTNTSLNGVGAGGALYQEEQYVSSTGAYTATGTNSQNDAYLATISTFKLTTTSISSGFTIPNTPTVIKIGPGTLQNVVLNTAGATGSSVTFYDNVTNSGSILAVIALTGSPVQLPYNLDFSTGLTMVVNSITPDFTVVYD